MGEQSPACDRNRRRLGMGDDAERMGRNLANPETTYSMDKRKRREWNADSRKIKAHGKNGVPDLPCKCVHVDPAAVLHGSSKSLPNVRAVERIDRKKNGSPKAPK